MNKEIQSDEFSRPGYARTRGAYIAECAFEYFVALLVADPFLTKLLLYIGIDDATVSVLQSLISVAFLFQLFALLAYFGNYLVTSVIFRRGNSFVDPQRRARYAATKGRYLGFAPYLYKFL